MLNNRRGLISKKCAAVRSPSNFNGSNANVWNVNSTGNLNNGNNVNNTSGGVRPDSYYKLDDNEPRIID